MKIKLVLFSSTMVLNAFVCNNFCVYLMINPTSLFWKEVIFFSNLQVRSHYYNQQKLTKIITCVPSLLT